MIVLTLLFLNLIEAEAHRLQLVVEEGVALSGLTLQCALLRGDLLRIVEGVLVVHTVVAEGDCLSRALALDTQEVQDDSLFLLGGIDHLHDDLARILVEY